MDSLAAIGEHVRREAFSNARSVFGLGSDAQKILAHLFAAQDVEDRGLTTIAGRAGLDEDFARYSLDQLEELGFALLGSIDSEDSCYGITPAGRACVGKHKLVPRG